MKSKIFISMFVCIVSLSNAFAFEFNDTPGFGYNYDSEISNQDLFDAAQSGSLELVDFYLDMGADINAVDQEGWTVLMVAIEANAPIELIAFLIENGVDINAESPRNDSAYWLARLVKRQDIIDLLLQHDVNVPSEDQRPDWVPGENNENNNEVVKTKKKAKKKLKKAYKKIKKKLKKLF